MSALLGTIAWQRMLIVALVLTNGFTLAVAFSAIQMLRNARPSPEEITG